MGVAGSGVASYAELGGAQVTASGIDDATFDQPELADVG